MSLNYSNVIITFMTILDQIKLYHWQTLSYPRHKATDELHEELSGLVDKFVEVLHGRLNNDNKYRIMLEENTFIQIKNMNDKKGSELLKNIKKYLEGDDLKNVMNNYTDLITIRDEMLTAVNKSNYLFTLD